MDGNLQHHQNAGDGDARRHENAPEPAERAQLRLLLPGPAGELRRRVPGLRGLAHLAASLTPVRIAAVKNALVGDGLAGGYVQTAVGTGHYVGHWRMRGGAWR